MNYRALSLGLMMMCLMNPTYSATKSRQGDVASMELLEYLGSLLETKDGLFGPDLFIKKGISDRTDDKLKPNPALSEPAASSRVQSENPLGKEASNENK